MEKMMISMYVKTTKTANSVKGGVRDIGTLVKERVLKNERGSQSLEWLGIAAVVVILIGALTTLFGGSSGAATIAESIKTTISGWIDTISKSATKGDGK